MIVVITRREALWQGAASAPEDFDGWPLEWVQAQVLSVEPGAVFVDGWSE